MGRAQRRTSREVYVLEDENSTAVGLIPVTPETLGAHVSETWVSNWMERVGFLGKKGQICILPDPVSGQISSVFVGVENVEDLWGLASLPAQLPPGVYHILDSEGLLDLEQAALGFGLACYRFDCYRPGLGKNVKLALEPHLLQRVSEVLEILWQVRDWVNCPAEDLGPAQLAESAMELSDRYGGECTIFQGEELLAQGYPAIHRVGRASHRPPVLIDLSFGDNAWPKVTLVGKGVCFDSGGLDIKDSAGMLLMRKDMAGAAHVLGLARLILYYQLPIRLRVLIPAVDNSIGPLAYRPGDVLTTRKGLTVEVGNTDAEGRLILADALCEAASEGPDLLIDMATLTGAARVALGPELPALYSSDAKMAQRIVELGEAISDPVWAMPLYTPYRDLIEGTAAHLSNSGKAGYAGSITAALFLKEFVGPEVDWIHLDMSAWNFRSRPGRPEGAEVMAIRALFAYLFERYAA